MKQIISLALIAGLPKGVPPENCLPINRKDEDLSVNLRISVPDMEKMMIWNAPRVERLSGP